MKGVWRGGIGTQNIYIVKTKTTISPSRGEDREGGREGKWANLYV